MEVHGWTGNRNVTQLLDFMVQRGEVAVAGRSGKERLWDLTERVYPDGPAVPADEALFEFDYQLEMYKPAARRRWGYFALPILSGDRLVGKLDTTADREAGVLRVHAIHQDVPFTATVSAGIHREIGDLARWLELDLSLPR